MLVSVLFIGASTWVTEGKMRMGLWDTCVEYTPGRVDCSKFDPEGKFLSFD